MINWTMTRPAPKPPLAWLLAGLLVSACTSQIPALIRQGPVNSPSPALVREQVDDYTGQQVRWGGLLLATENRVDATWLTILARPLGADGEPGYSDDSLGRFIAIVPEFLDPQVYAPDRLVTVTGTLTHSESGMVGDHAYRYPVVAAQAWYLWPEPAVVPYGAPYYGGWYDPWYGPWWYGPGYAPWYSPWWHGSWYDPWYYRRPHPYRDPYRRWHDHPDVTPPPHADPAHPEHRHPHPGHRNPPVPPDADAAPRHERKPDRQREGRRERDQPVPPERTDDRTVPRHERNTEHQREAHEAREQPVQQRHERPDEDAAAPRHVRNADRQREERAERLQPGQHGPPERQAVEARPRRGRGLNFQREERSMERLPPPEPMPAAEPDRGWRERLPFFRRRKGD